MKSYVPIPKHVDIVKHMFRRPLRGYPQTVEADPALADGTLLSEDMNEVNPHPSGISKARAR